MKLLNKNGHEDKSSYSVSGEEPHKDKITLFGFYSEPAEYGQTGTMFLCEAWVVNGLGLALSNKQCRLRGRFN